MARRKPLPPFGAEYLKRHPHPAIKVALGARAWSFARRAGVGRVMILPDDGAPAAFRWPSNGHPALVYELGPPDDNRLAAMARELLAAGSPSVVAIRYSLLNTSDCRLFFERADHVA
ncbi:MAG: hypothetical protein IH987_18465 [Planctomycetes bacterium]|nr:hypothetical protein [Planctomycetota bacterium]